MEARFLLFPDDIYYYHRYGYRHLRSFRLSILFPLAWMIALSALIYLPISPFHNPFFEVFWLVATLLSLAYHIGLYKTILFWHTSVDRSLRGEHWMLLNPTGILYRSWRGEQVIPWQQVQSIEQDAYNIYFLLKSDGPLADHFQMSRRIPLFLNRVCIVPKRAFGNPLNAGAFVDAAISLRGNVPQVQLENSFGGSRV